VNTYDYLDVVPQAATRISRALFERPGIAISKACGLRYRFQFTSQSQKMLDSCAHNQARATSIVRSDGNERAVVCPSRNLKYSPAADTLQLRWIGPPPSDNNLLVVKVEQYMIRL
jgi:hypothetical protein